jgi:uncharacterized membrane protein YobD (UPF0266 family)
LVCEEGIFEVEAINNLSIPHNSKTILVKKPHTIIKKIGIYYTNCHTTNHNIETCRVKRKEILFLQFPRLPLSKSKYKDL